MGCFLSPARPETWGDAAQVRRDDSAAGTGVSPRHRSLRTAWILLPLNRRLRVKAQFSCCGCWLPRSRFAMGGGGKGIVRESTPKTWLGWTAFTNLFLTFQSMLACDPSQLSHPASSGRCELFTWGEGRQMETFQRLTYDPGFSQDEKWWESSSCKLILSQTAFVYLLKCVRARRLQSVWFPGSSRVPVSYCGTSQLL